MILQPYHILSHCRHTVSCKLTALFLCLFLACQCGYFLTGKERVQKTVEEAVPYCLGMDYRRYLQINEDRDDFYHAPDMSLLSTSSQRATAIYELLRQKLAHTLRFSSIAVEVVSNDNYNSRGVVGDFGIATDSYLLPGNYTLGEGHSVMRIYLQIHRLDIFFSLFCPGNALLTLALIVLYMLSIFIWKRWRRYYSSGRIPSASTDDIVVIPVIAHEDTVTTDDAKTITDVSGTFTLPDGTVFTPATHMLRHGQQTVELRKQASQLLEAFSNMPDWQLTFQEVEALFWDAKEDNGNRRSKLVSDLRSKLKGVSDLTIENVERNVYRIVRKR